MPSLNSKQYGTEDIYFNALAYLELLYQVIRVNKIDIDYSASFLIEVHLFDPFESQSRREWPVRHEQNDIVISLHEVVEFLISNYFGKLLPINMLYHTWRIINKAHLFDKKI